MAEIDTVFTACTEVVSNAADVAGGSDHRCTVSIGIHRPTATLAAIADGIEAIQHGVLKKSVMNMAALMLFLQNFHSFFRRDPAGTARVVLDDKTGKGLANDEAYIKR